MTLLLHPVRAATTTGDGSLCLDLAGVHLGGAVRELHHVRGALPRCSSPASASHVVLLLSVADYWLNVCVMLARRAARRVFVAAAARRLRSIAAMTCEVISSTSAWLLSCRAIPEATRLICSPPDAARAVRGIGNPGTLTARAATSSRLEPIW